MKTLLFTLIFLALTSYAFCQKRCTREIIKGLQEKYCIDRKELKREKKLLLINNEAPPPPSPKAKFSDRSCKRKYKIPSQEILDLYPFNVDSILIAIPEYCFWEGENKKASEIGKLSVEQIASLADVLYNYGYKKLREISISVSNTYGCGREIPTFRLIFCNGNDRNFLDIYSANDDLNYLDNFDNNNPYEEKIESEEQEEPNENAICWGGYCTTTFDLLYDFVKKEFNHEIRKLNYENDCNDSTIEIIDLIEH